MPSSLTWLAISMSLYALAADALATEPACRDVRLGGFDPNNPEHEVSYINPEFTPDGRYLVWFEPDPAPNPQGILEGTVWHCAVDAETGALDPSDGRGFPAFRSTVTKRANPGIDAAGVYYVGADPDGWLKLVRPTAKDAGVVVDLPAAGPGPLRRGIFPSQLPERESGFVFWFRADRGQTPSQANRVAVEYIDLQDPATVVLVEEQVNPLPPFTWTPMDITVPRWFTGQPAFTYGFVDPADPDRTLQVRAADLSDPDHPTITRISSDRFDHTAAQPFIHDGQRCFVTGVDTTVATRVYCETQAGEPFALTQATTLPGSSLQTPCRAISYEPFSHAGRTYATYVVSDCDASGSFFVDAGEIWVLSVDGGPLVQQRLSRLADETQNEPEVLAGPAGGWVFYTAYPTGADPLRVTYELRRVPARFRAGDFDCDRDVDLRDLASLQPCVGFSRGSPSPCEIADLDFDGAWSAGDFRAWCDGLAGPGY